MNNHQEFFQIEVPQLLKGLKENAQGKWGSMHVAQMVDHLHAGTLLMLSKKSCEIEVAEDKLARYKVFLMSDKDFMEGAPKPSMYREYEKTDFDDFELSKEKLAHAVKEFELVTRTDKDFYSFHPSFGELNAEETRQLQFKHIRHHFQQFGLR
jgi:oxepin-CoA hydrolase/3-oxo-5,6-dehydrosuberyl-CoA semialdehyde dehydrogenase